MELDATYKATLMSLQIATVCGYLLGSIPFGLVLTRMAGLGDIRKIGSGNIGATNVLRTGNKFLAFLTLVGDVGKGGDEAAVRQRVAPDRKHGAVPNIAFAPAHRSAPRRLHALIHKGGDVSSP